MLGRAEGIVIRSMDYGEGHRIFVLLTPHAGKISLIARGAKKTKSRHGSATQLFTHGEYTFFSGRGLGNLRYVEVIHSYREIHQDVVKAAYAAYMAEMADRMLEDNESGEALFRQFLAGLDGIAEDKDADIILSIFELFMLRYTGYSPQLERCVDCGRTKDLAFFHAPSGGVLCAKCASLEQNVITLTPKSHYVLSRLNQLDLRRVGSINVSPDTKAGIMKITSSMMDEHVPVKWRSRSVLEQMKKFSNL